MKTRLYLIALLAQCFSMTAVADPTTSKWAAPVKPIEPVRELFDGDWVTPEAGNTYYIYNVGAAQFMGCGREWGTRTIATVDSIVSPIGSIFAHATNKDAAIPYTISSVDDTEYIRFVPQNTDMSRYVSGLAGGNASWNDTNDSYAANWQLIPDDDSNFLLHDAKNAPYDPSAYIEDNPETEVDESASSDVNKYGLLAVDEIGTASYTWINAWAGANANGKTYKVAWKFIEATDDVARSIRVWRTETQATYDAEIRTYNAALAIYNAKVSLRDAMLTVDAAGIDVTAAEAVYFSETATVEDILSARTALLMAYKLTDFKDAPKEITEILYNPDFEMVTPNGKLPSGWDITITGQYVGQQNRKDMNPETGLTLSNFVEAWSPYPTIGDGVIAQTVYGLPKGIYHLVCDASVCHDPANGDGTDIEGAGLFIKSGTLRKSLPIGTPRLGIDHFSVTFINDGMNPVQFGLYAEGTNANWLSADNFQLFYDGPLPSIYLDATEFAIEAGGAESINLDLKNQQTNNIVAFQMDLMLPEGVDIDKTGCTLSSRITDEEQELTIGKLESGAYRLTSTSLSLTPISGNDGKLLTLKLTAEDGCVGGQATISNIIFSTSESDKIVMNDESFDINILYKVTYKVDGDEYQTDRFVYNTAVTPLDNITKEGYTFSGWSEIPETMPAHDVEVTGSFTINYYTLTYTLDGEEYKTSTVAYGTEITAEEELSKEGYTFSGWSEIPQTMPAHDVEITGSFSINYYTLTYKVDGEEYKTSTIAYGTKITAEEEVVKEGYTFSGWSEIPKTMPAHDVEITGSFSINSYVLTYLLDDEEYKTSTATYGTELTPESEPTEKEGYAFSGWSEIPETMPAHDVVVSGHFYPFGDVNTDEEVDVVDVVDIARFLVATPSDNFIEKLADINKDNTVNIADAVALVNYIAGDQNFVKAKTPSSQCYDYSQCQLQLLSTGQDALSLCLNGDADFTAFQFDIDVPDNLDISAMRINGLRKDSHQLLYNKVADNRYRVAALSLTNATFKGNEGELLQISVNGQPTDDICVHDIHFVTTNGTDITFDSLALSGPATGIINTNVHEGNDVIYDLQGRKLSKVQRGVNIVNGKKVLVN